MNSKSGVETTKVSLMYPTVPETKAVLKKKRNKTKHNGEGMSKNQEPIKKITMDKVRII